LLAVFDPVAVYEMYTYMYKQTKQLYICLHSQCSSTYL